MQRKINNERVETIVVFEIAFAVNNSMEAENNKNCFDLIRKASHNFILKILNTIIKIPLII